jgi:mannose-1-phosphate guanylyltransferase
MSTPTPSATALERLHVCIMAGGSGERFWPLSRTATPKHLLKLFSDRTLLEETARRFEGIVPPERIFVLTNVAQLASCREALPFLPEENILGEPAKRDTAPAATLAMALSLARRPDALCLLLPADARIQDVETFRAQILESVAAVDKRPVPLVFAVPPTYPATAFGYLELGEELDPGLPAVKVERFVEKPDEDRAKEFLASGRFGWNAGIFLWPASLFRSEAARELPALARFIDDFLKAAASPQGYAPFLQEAFPHLPKISVDYAIMEQTPEVQGIRTRFDWDDVGSWTALPTHLGADDQGNTLRGPVAIHESRDNIVYSNGRQIALCGVEQLVIVETPDAVLVSHREYVQEIKKLHAQLPDELK